MKADLSTWDSLIIIQHVNWLFIIGLSSIVGAPVLYDIGGHLMELCVVSFSIYGGLRDFPIMDITYKATLRF